MQEVRKNCIEEGSPLWFSLKARSTFSIHEFARILAGYPPYADIATEDEEDWCVIRSFEEALIEELTWGLEPSDISDIEEDIPF